jgi:uncharacterized protein (TIGR03437 family)
MSVRWLSILVLLPQALSAQAPREVAPQPFQLNVPLGVTPDTSAPGTVVYQNTANPTGAGFTFSGHATLGSNLAANVDINMLTLAAGSAGQSISALSFLAYNSNSVAVEARPTMYIWAAGDGGTPTTLLGSFVLPLTSLAASNQQALSLTLPGGGIIVPANGEIWAGIGFDNDNGASTIAATQLDNLGALTYHPATVGTDGPNAYFIPPGASLNDPAVIPFGSAFTANYGWTVQANTSVATANASVASAAPAISTSIAPGSLASAYGTDLANNTAGGASLPLPTSFGGTSISILDDSGNVTAAPLLYVIPTQVNFEVPPGVATGPATVTITSGDGTQSAASVQVASVAPGIFELNSGGLAAAYVILYHADGTQTVEQVYTVSAGAVVTTPVSLGSSTDKPYLFIFGTGLRDAGTSGVTVTVGGISVPVSYAGPQGGFVGLDQVNVQLPTSLAGSGNVTIQVMANSIAANAVNVTIQ